MARGSSRSKFHPARRSERLPEFPRGSSGGGAARGYVSIESYDDLYPEELERLVSGKMLMPNEEMELKEVFMTMADFVDTVVRGESWPAQKVLVMRRRANALRRIRYGFHWRGR